jgi:hypothetical protein
VVLSPLAGLVWSLRSNPRLEGFSGVVLETSPHCPAKIDAGDRPNTGRPRFNFREPFSPYLWRSIQPISVLLVM